MSVTNIRKFTPKKEWKLAFLTTWIVGLLAHAYRFFNFLPTWDSIYNFRGVGTTYGLGRWFLPYAGLISSMFDMPWVNGALSLLYIGISMILLVELFELRRSILIVTMAAVFVSFPTVVSTFAYMYTADCYMLAFLLSVSAVYLTDRIPRWGVPAGVVALAFSMGIYQAYACTAIVLVLLIIIRQFAIEGMLFTDAVKKDLKFLITLIGGAALYAVILKLVLLHFDASLAGYQGIGTIGIMSLAEYKIALLRTKARFSYMVGLDHGLTTQSYGLLHTGIFAVLAVLLVYSLIKNRVYEKKLSFLSAIVAILLFPVGAYAVNFTSPDVEYHTLMEMALCFLYLIVILFLEQLGWEKLFPKILRICGTGVVLLLVYYNVVNANIAWYNMNLSYQKSYAIAENILDRIENMDEFQTVTNKVAIMGVYDAYTENIPWMTPVIMGISNGSFLNDDLHYKIFWNNCFGIQVEMPEYEERAAITQTEEYQNMPVYPAKGSVAYINDMIVVRLSE